MAVLTPDQVRHWEVGSVKDLADRAHGIDTALCAIADNLRRVIDDLDWSGGDSRKQATDRADREHDQIRALAGAYRSLGDAALGFYQEANYAMGFLKTTTASLQNAHFTVDPDWTVHDPAGGTDGTAADDTRSMKSNAAHLGEMFDKYCPQMSAAVDAIRSHAPTTAGQFVVNTSDIDELEFHERLLAKYKTNPDPGGMVTYQPHGVTGWISGQLGFKPERMTATEAHMLDDLSTSQLLTAAQAKEVAANSALTVFKDEHGDGGRGDGHADAFRHAYWNAMLAEKLGPEWTKKYTTAHEGATENQQATAEAMDLHNNEVGRQIAAEHPGASNSELAGYVKQAVQNGRMVVIDPNGLLKPSNAAHPNQTGHPFKYEGMPTDGFPNVRETPTPKDTYTW